MSSPARVRVTACPDGPLLVRGADEIIDEQGAIHAVTRPVVALCRCDMSQRMPWCDGTHRALLRARLNREDNGRAPQSGDSAE